jgi:hypothetical protein
MTTLERQNRILLAQGLPEEVSLVVKLINGESVSDEEARSVSFWLGYYNIQLDFGPMVNFIRILRMNNISLPVAKALYQWTKGDEMTSSEAANREAQEILDDIG